MATIEENRIFQGVLEKKMAAEIKAAENKFKTKKKTSSLEPEEDQKKNLIDFMLELIGTLMGKISKVKKKIAEGKKRRKKKIAAIKSSIPPIVLTLLINVLSRLLPTMQQKVMDLLMKYLSDNCSLDTPNLSLPQGLITGQGLAISARNLDIFRILKEDYNSRLGKIFYGNSNNSFAATLRDAALNTVPTPITYPYIIIPPNAGLDVRFDSSNNRFIIKANSALQNASLKDFFNAMLKKVIPFTPETFIALATDKLYGTLSKKIDVAVGSIGQARTRDDIETDEYVHTIIENYLDYNLEDIVETDTFYTFTDAQKGLIEANVNDRYNGEGSFIADCGEVAASISPEFFDETMDLFTGATKSSESKVVGQVLNVLGDVATNNVGSGDKDTAKKSFFSKLIKLFPSITTKMFLTPDVIFLMEIAKIIKGAPLPFLPGGAIDVPEVKSTKEFLRNNSTIMRQIAKEFYGEIMKELYIIVKEEITKLVLTYMKAMIAEQAKNYLAIIVSGINARANKALQAAKKVKK